MRNYGDTELTEAEAEAKQAVNSSGRKTFPSSSHQLIQNIKPFSSYTEPHPTIVQLFHFYAFQAFKSFIITSIVHITIKQTQKKSFGIIQTELGLVLMLHFSPVVVVVVDVLDIIIIIIRLF